MDKEVLLSEDALNQAILGKWEAAGLTADNDDVDVTPEPDVTDVDDTPADDTPADDAPADDVVDDTPAADDTEQPTDGETPAEETPDPAPETPDATQTAAEAQKEAEDDLAAALGLGKPPDDPKKRAQWWKTRVPYSQLHKVVTEREKKLKDTHETTFNEHRTQAERFRADVKQVEDIITGNAEQYVRTLAAMFPDTYGKMFAPILNGGKTQEQPLPKEADLGPMPEPDLDLGDGRMTYSVEGLKKLREWDAAQLEQKMLKRIQPTIEEIDRQKKAAKDAADAEDRRIRGAQTAEQVIAEAKTWDLGTENLEEMLTVAAKLDPRYDAMTAMNIAYRQVVVPKLKADRDKMRADILAEQKKASAKKTSTAIATSQTLRTAEKPDPSKASLDDRIKAAWKRKGLIP